MHWNVLNVYNCVKYTKLKSAILHDWAMIRDFQQFGMCDQQSLRSSCTYAQTDQSLCRSLIYSLTVKLLTLTNRTSFGVSKLNRRLHRLVWVYTFQNTTLLESHVAAHMFLIWAVTREFQQCGILTSVDSDEPVQPTLKPRTLKWGSVST